MRGTPPPSEDEGVERSEPPPSDRSELHRSHLPVELEPDVVATFEQALDGHQLTLHHQPELDLRTGRVRGVESLLRWHHPTFGDISPAPVVALVERTALVDRLAAWVVDQALRDARSWADEGFGIRVAINLSARNLHDPGLPDAVERALDAAGLPGASLEVEVTESLELEDTARAASTLRRLRTLGVTVAIDDFGTGFGHLTSLHDLPADVLKVARSFVGPMVDDDRSASIVGATVELAHALDMAVIAEGVETPEVLAAVRSVGFDAAQGFGIGRPVPGDRLPGLVRAIEVRNAGQHLSGLPGLPA
jgi:EAL domain-containing protein (putative c-di-GMP-specific phosphodiesterase class I)